MVMFHPYYLVSKVVSDINRSRKNFGNFFFTKKGELVPSLEKINGILNAFPNRAQTRLKRLILKIGKFRTDFYNLFFFLNYKKNIEN
jgi:hypothetical protein